MKKVIVISDSHGNMENVRKIFAKEKEVDMVIHLGDILSQDELLRKICGCPTVIVKGNCDIITTNKVSEIIEIDGIKVFATHGHQYGVYYGLDQLCMAADNNGCMVAMYGHTHVPDNTIFRGMYLLNPGSVSKPRQLNHKPTYAVMKIEEKKIDIRVEYV